MHNMPAPFTSTLPAGPRRMVELSKHKHQVFAWAMLNGGYSALLAYHRQDQSYDQARFVASREWRGIKRHGLPGRPVWLDGDMIYGVASPDSGSGQPFWPMFLRNSSLEAAVIAENLV